MAITTHLAKFILSEHKYQPILGKVLLVGRQSTFFTIDYAKKLLSELGVTLSDSAYEKIDAETRDGRCQGFIEDKSFFSLFTDALVDVIDVSDYEGANIIHDLQKPISKEYFDKYDFIFNGSCLDNIFDPVRSNINLSLMLKENGRIIHYESATDFFGSYLMFSPDWFFDYYAVNHFVDCKTYRCVWEDSFHNNDWDVYQYTPFHNQTANGEWLRTPTFKSDKQSTIVVVAQKGAQSTSENLPLQYGYRSDDDRYIEQQKIFSSNERSLDLIIKRVMNKKNNMTLLKRLLNKMGIANDRCNNEIPGCVFLGKLN